MPHLYIYLIPPTSDEALLEKYALRMRPVRLHSLQLDPDSFISNYESEAAQPVDFWIGRLKDPAAHHIVIVKSPDEQATQDSEVLLRDVVEWVGLAVCIETRKASASLVERERLENGGRAGEWFLAAVYIDRSVRGWGAGKKLVQFGIDHMREVEREWGPTESICVTNVIYGNDTALCLYQKLGFQITNPDSLEQKEGRTYHTTGLELRL